MVVSYTGLAEATGLTVQKVRTVFKKLKATGDLTVKTTNKYSLLTIENYSKFQGKQQASNTPTNTQPNTQSTTTKEVKKLRKKDITKVISKESFKTPDCVDQGVWDAFLANRTELKAQNTDYALKLVVNRLSELKARGHDPTALLNTAIEHGWKTIYEPKDFKDGNSNRNYGSNRKSSTDLIAEQLHELNAEVAARGNPIQQH